MADIPYISHNWELKLAALGLAILLWSVTKAEEITRVPVPNVPVQIALNDQGWVPQGIPVPANVTVIFAGPVRDLARLAVERPRVVIPVEEVDDSVMLRLLRTGWVQLDGDFDNIRVEDIRPSTVRLTFERLTTRLVPFAVALSGNPPPGMRLAPPVDVDPDFARVSGPEGRLRALDSLRLGPFDLRQLSGSAVVELPVDTSGIGDLVVAPLRANVAIHLVPAPVDTTRVVEPEPGLVVPPTRAPQDTAAGPGVAPPQGGVAPPGAANRGADASTPGDTAGRAGASAPSRE